MVVPREHGAWGMLLVPLVTGAGAASHIGINAMGVTLFFVAAMAMFWLRTPLESWLGTSPSKARTAHERSVVLRTILGIGALVLASIVGLLWAGYWELIVVGGVSAFAFSAQAVVKKLGRRGRMPAQIIGAIGLTSTAAGAYYVATGRLDRTAIALWLANWLFAADQIHFVQVRIHSCRAESFEEKVQLGLPFLVGQIGMIAVVLAACHFSLFPFAAAAAFLPVLLRGTLWFVRKRQPLDVRRLGLTELGHSLVFGGLLCAAFLM